MNMYNFFFSLSCEKRVKCLFLKYYCSVVMFSCLQIVWQSRKAYFFTYFPLSGHLFPAVFFFIKFSNRVHFAGNFVDYWVVKTDYTNYSVVYECSKLNDDNTCKKIITWVFSRHQTLPESLMAEVDHVIENLCLNETQFYTTTYSKSKTYFSFFRIGCFICIDAIFQKCSL